MSNTTTDKADEVVEDGVVEDVAGKADEAGAFIDILKEKAEEVWEKAREAADKGWDKTKVVADKGWDKTKVVADKSWDKTKDVSAEVVDKVKHIVHKGDDEASDAADAVEAAAEDVKPG